MSSSSGLVIRDPWYDWNTNPAFPNQPNRAFQDRMGATLADLGVRWVRFEFHVEGGDAEAEIARYDYFVNEVAPRHGIAILALLGFGLVRTMDPRALNDPLVTTDPIYGGGVNAFMRAWLDRARLVVRRYGGRIGAYEVLNEQNRLPPNGQPGSDGDAIRPEVAARLHTKFYRFFHQVDRQGPGEEWRDVVPIITGGLHPAGSGTFRRPGYVSDIEYLRRLYTSAPFAGYAQANGRFPLDGVGYHPYPVEICLSLGRRPGLADCVADDAALIAQRLDQLRAALDELGQGQAPFWITEIGCNAGYARKTEAGQAEFLTNVMGMLARRPDVAQSFWFKYEDFPPADGPNAQRWGVVRIPFVAPGSSPGGADYDIEGAPDHVRTAYEAFQQLVRG
jgi:hypothetical protein